MPCYLAYVVGNLICLFCQSNQAVSPAANTPASAPEIDFFSDMAPKIQSAPRVVYLHKTVQHVFLTSISLDLSRIR